MTSVLTPPSTRPDDTRQEKVVVNFIKKFFFDLSCCDDLQVVDDRELQVAGVDIIANGLNIDLKAQASPAYINKPTDTFILELSFLASNGNLHCGWFLNEKYITDRIAFIWIHNAKVNAKGMIANENDIEKLELMFVDKHQLKAHINKVYSDEDLLSIAKFLMNSGYTKKDSKINGTWFRHTNHLWEKPTNLVCKKWFLKQFSTGHYMITKNSIEEIL